MNGSHLCEWLILESKPIPQSPRLSRVEGFSYGLFLWAFSLGEEGKIED